MTRIIRKEKPSRAPLTPAERGVLWHLLETRAAEGTVQQHYTDIAQMMGTATSTIHRHIQGLIAKGAVEVITPSQKDRRGYPIPPVLKPIPPVEYANSTCGTRPIPIGAAFARNGIGLTRINTGTNPISNGAKPVPNGMHKHNALDSTDCVVRKDVGSGLVDSVSVVHENPVPPVESASKPKSDSKPKLQTEIRNGKEIVIGGLR